MTIKTMQNGLAILGQVAQKKGNPAVLTAMSAYAEIVVSFAKIIKHATENEVFHGMPSGELYARVMDKMSMDMYNDIINLLLRLGIVRATHDHLLIYQGEDLFQSKQ